MNFLKKLDIIAPNDRKSIFCFVYYKENCISIVNLKRTTEIVTFLSKAIAAPSIVEMKHYKRKLTAAPYK